MKNLNMNVRDADSNTTKHRFPWKWRLSDLKSVEQNGKKVFSCFSCGGGSTMGYKLAGYTVVGNCEIDEDMEAMVEKYESGKNDFYRTEMTLNQTFDPAMLYHFKGITYYSSTMNGDIYLMMERLGNRVYAQNVSTVYQPTPIQDMMFGVRYHYTTMAALVGYGTEVEKHGRITVIESPWTLGVAFAANEDLKAYTSEGKAAMDAQNDIKNLFSNNRNL